MRRFSVISVGLAAVMLALSPITAAAAAPTRCTVSRVTTCTGISGLEIFQGFRPAGSVYVYGATFAGWTDIINKDVPTSWTQWPGNGGNWILSINYKNAPGPGVSVTVTGGLWSLRTAHGSRYSGVVVAGGTVTWSSAKGFGCGEGNAEVFLRLFIAGGGTGTVTGCLNDLYVFPPHVWGTVSLTLPDGGDN